VGTGGNTTGSGGATKGTGGRTSGGGGTTQGGGGSTGNGGDTGSCANVAACGGDVTGTWNISSSCLKVSGEMDLGSFGIGCKSAPVTDGSLQVTGTWTAGSDGKITDKTKTTGTVHFTLDKTCLEISGTTTNCESMNGSMVSLGFSEVDCQAAASGGGCTCTGTSDQSGSPGRLSNDPQTTGKVTMSGNDLTYPDEMKYSYCVADSTMTWTPQSTKPTITGTMVFQKQ
jgi:hypothetical protein